MQPSTLQDLSSCAVTTPAGPDMGHVLLISWGSHMTASSHGNDAGFTWTSIIAPYHLSGLVFEIVATWALKLLHFTRLLPGLLPTLKRRPSPLTPPQVQWTQGAFYRGSQDPRGSWKPWLVGWEFPRRQDWTVKWQKVLHIIHAPRKNWAATPSTAVKILAASIIPVDRCSKPSSGMRILLLGLMILGLFTDSGRLASSFPPSLLSCQDFCKAPGTRGTKC